MVQAHTEAVCAYRSVLSAKQQSAAEQVGGRRAVAAVEFQFGLFGFAVVEIFG